MVGILLQIVKLQFCLLSVFLRAAPKVATNLLCNLEQIIQALWTSVSSSIKKEQEEKGKGSRGRGSGRGREEREKDWMT